MDLNLPITLVLLALVLGGLAYAVWQGNRPVDPTRIRMVNYRYVQIACIVLTLVILAHLLTLFVGHPVTGRRISALFATGYGAAA